MELSEVNCPIWDTPARVEATGGDRQIIYSERIGAKYEVTGSAGVTLVNWNDNDKAKRAALSQAILEAQINGAILRISSDDLTDGSSLLRSRSWPENLNLLLKTAKWLFPILGQDIFNHRALRSNLPPEYAVAIGWSEVEFTPATRKLLMKCFESARRRGWIQIGEHEFGFQLEGFEFVESLAMSSQTSQSIFVAMWFGSEATNQYYDLAVKPAIEAAGYRCVRIDEEEHNERIDEQILAEIRKSRGVLVDITCGLSRPEGEWSQSELVGAPRGGVYFEAGFAAGLALPIIWTVQQAIADAENVVHFDIRQYNQIRWTNDHDENRLKLQARIEATLGRGDRR